MMVKTIYIPTDGIENVLLNVIWHVLLTALRTGKSIEAEELSYPVKSADVLAIMDEMAMGVGEEVDKKLIHLSV